MDANADSDLDTFFLFQTGIQVSHHSEDAKTSAYCSLRIILMCLGIAKVHQESIPKELGDMPIVALNNFRTHLLICTHHVPVLFGIKLAGEFCGIDQVTEHHCEL